MNSAARVSRPPKPTADTVSAFGRPVWRVSVEQYHRMIEAGVFVGRKCELIHGYLLQKPVPDPPHSRTTHRLLRRLGSLFPEPDWVIGIKDSITLADSEPEPDFFAAIGPDDKYTDRHPGPKDLVLVIEVSNTTKPFDRNVKLPMYAAAKIRDFWIIDVNARQIEIYTQPRGGTKPTFRNCVIRVDGETVPVVAAGKTLGSIPVSELLP